MAEVKHRGVKNLTSAMRMSRDRSICSDAPAPIQHLGICIIGKNLFRSLRLPQNKVNHPELLICCLAIINLAIS